MNNLFLLKYWVNYISEVKYKIFTTAEKAHAFHQDYIYINNRKNRTSKIHKEILHYEVLAILADLCISNSEQKGGE